MGLASRSETDVAGLSPGLASLPEDGRPEQPRDLRRTYVRPRRGWQAIALRELWQHRDLLAIFTARDVKVRYRQTFFGVAWALVVPAIQILVFTIFFGNVLGVSDRVNRAAGRDLPYPLFALTGQIVWNMFRMAVEGASGSLLANAAIIRKIYVPRLLLPLSALGKPLVDTAAVLVLMIGIIAYYASGAEATVTWSARALWSPLILLGSAIPAPGIGMIVAAATVGYRDLQYVLPFFTSVLFFVTPVIYSVDVLPERFAWLMHLNPVAGFVEAHRAAVFNLPFDLGGFMLSAAISVALLVFGLFFFTRAERDFADLA